MSQSICKNPEESERLRVVAKILAMAVISVAENQREIPESPDSIRLRNHKQNGRINKMYMDKTNG